MSMTATGWARRAVRAARRVARRIVRGPAPAPDPRTLFLQTDISSACNLRCKICYFSTLRDLPYPRLTGERFRRLFGPLAPRVRTLGLSCGAEPLMARREDLFDILDFVRESGIPDSFLATNGMLLTRDVADKIVESGLTTVHLSIDSRQPEVYADIRTGAKLATVEANVRYLMEARRLRGAAHPVLRCNCVLMRDTIEDSEGLVDFIHGLGATQVDFRHLLLYKGQGLVEQSLWYHKALANEHLGRLRRKCAELGIEIMAMPSDFDLSRTEVPVPESPCSRPCTFPSTYVLVRPDGTVYPCPFWAGELPVGNLFEQDFDTLWASEPYATLRAETERGVLRRHCCQHCPALGGGDVNNPQSFEPK